MAAEQGNAVAGRFLGMAYRIGKSVTTDAAEALKWFRLAAEEGDCYAQYFLGLMYEAGDCVSQNPREAAYWFKLAADQGNSDAQHSLGLLHKNGAGGKVKTVGSRQWAVGRGMLAVGRRKKVLSAEC